MDTNNMNTLAASIVANQIANDETLMRLYVNVPTFTQGINAIVYESGIASIDDIIQYLMYVIGVYCCRITAIEEMIEKHGSDELKTELYNYNLKDDVIGRFLSLDKDIQSIINDALKDTPSEHANNENITDDHNNNETCELNQENKAENP